MILVAFSPLLRSYGKIRWKTKVIFLILLSCLVGIGTKTVEKTVFNFYSFYRFPSHMEALDQKQSWYCWFVIPNVVFSYKVTKLSYKESNRQSNKKS
jgi:hypothetical protein